MSVLVLSYSYDRLLVQHKSRNSDNLDYMHTRPGSQAYICLSLRSMVTYDWYNSSGSTSTTPHNTQMMQLYAALQPLSLSDNEHSEICV